MQTTSHSRLIYCLAGLVVVLALIAALAAGCGGSGTKKPSGSGPTNSGTSTGGTTTGGTSTGSGGGWG
jgi:hypothetical protein